VKSEDWKCFRFLLFTLHSSLFIFHFLAFSRFAR
jgi:hypothetical protein